MPPNYAVAWWKARNLKPPQIDPVEFLRKKLEWRYAKGIPATKSSKIYLGDSVDILSQMSGNLRKHALRRPSLMLTSPPYLGITNYHYDQWLRLWMLGGPPTDRRTHSPYNGRYRRKFENRMAYGRLLMDVFDRASLLMKPDAIVYVRTDRRRQTLTITREALKRAFPKHSLKQADRPIRGKTQTRLFGNGDPRLGEVDLLMTP